MKIDEGVIPPVGSFSPKSAVEPTRPSPTPAKTTSPSPEPASRQSQTETQQVDRVDLEAAVEAINSRLHLDQRSIQFRVEGATDQVVVSVTDQETGELVRQIPQDVALKLAENLEDLNGSLVSSYG